MKKTQVNSVAIVFLAMAILSSCVREVVLDAGERPQVVVECVLTNDETQELRLNFTKGASKDEAEPLNEAVVTLIDMTGQFTVGEFEKQEGNLWTLKCTPIPMHTYRLEVEVPGYDLIYAEDSMPMAPEVYIGSSGIYGITISHFADRTYDAGSLVSKKYKDKTGKLVFHRGSYYYLPYSNHPIVVYGMNHNPVSGEFELMEHICTDHPSVLSGTLSGGQYVPSPKSSEEPQMQLYPILEGVPLHRHYMIFPRNAYDEETLFLISGSYTGQWWSMPGKNTGTDPNHPDYGKPGGYMAFVSMSDNYMRYLEDAIRYLFMQESSDLTKIYLRDNIYSNITGGVGLFAAISETQTGWRPIYTDMEKWEEYWYSDKYKYIDDDGRYHYEDGHWGYYYPDM